MYHWKFSIDKINLEVSTILNIIDCKHGNSNKSYINKEIIVNGTILDIYFDNLEFNSIIELKAICQHYLQAYWKRDGKYPNDVLGKDDNNVNIKKIDINRTIYFDKITAIKIDCTHQHHLLLRFTKIINGEKIISRKYNGIDIHKLDIALSRILSFINPGISKIQAAVIK